MSAGAQPFLKVPRSRDVLRDLLHSLSQPLTSLRCSLELSIEEIADSRQESVAVALQQTEKVIGMIQLMRQYLDAEQPGSGGSSVPLAPTLLNVVEELSSIAAIREIQFHVAGTCGATVSVPEPRLRLALQYLISAMIDAQPVQGEVTLLIEEGSSEAVLRVQGERGSRPAADGASSSPRARDPVSGTLCRVKLAIASRVLESAGASLVFDDGNKPGFVLRVPRRPSVSCTPP